MSEIWLGCDPDLHTTAIAVADAEKVYAVYVVRIDEDMKGEKAVFHMTGALGDAMHEIITFQVRSMTPNRQGLTGIVVEGQQLLTNTKKRANPDELLNLACVTGAALSAARPWALEALRPKPSTWKGSVPKLPQQAQTCAHYGWTYDRKKDYVVPTPGSLVGVRGHEHLKPSDYKHVMDAIGLAKWASTRVTIERLEKDIEGAA